MSAKKIASEARKCAFRYTEIPEANSSHFASWVLYIKLPRIIDLFYLRAHAVIVTALSLENLFIAELCLI